MTIGLIVVVLVILGGWYVMQSQKSQPAATPSVEEIQTETTPATESAASTDAMEETVVVISSAGFMPKDVAIKVGESVTWMNEDSLDHTVNSAPHPTHTAYKPLNTVGALKAGEKKSLTFPEAGTYKYHDHLNPSLTGSVTVE